MSRIETGPVMFHYNNGEIDWPGVFIRGDSCFFYVEVLKNLKLVEGQNQFQKTSLEALIRLLETSNMGSDRYNKSNVRFVKVENV